MLRRLGHIDASGVVLPKGRAACEVDTADELVVTELMFDGAFGGLSPAACASLAACFIPTEKSGVEKMRPEVAPGFAALRRAAAHVAEVQADCAMEVEADEFVDSFKPTLCDAVFRWAHKEPFGEVMKHTDLFEGTVVRAIRRLDELLGQLAAAAKAAGDTALCSTFEEAAISLRHGICFANSLYI